MFVCQHRLTTQLTCMLLKKVKCSVKTVEFIRIVPFLICTMIRSGLFLAYLTFEVEMKSQLFIKFSILPLRVPLSCPAGCLLHINYFHIVALLM